MSGQSNTEILVAAGAAATEVFKAKGPVLLESVLVSELRLRVELALDSKANLEVGRVLEAVSIARAAAARPPRPPLLPAPRPLTDRTSGRGTSGGLSVSDSDPVVLRPRLLARRTTGSGSAV